MASYHLQNGIDPSHYGFTSAGAPEWPSLSWSSNNIPIKNVPGATSAENTTNEETMDSQKPDLKCTPDPTKTRAYR